MYTLLRIVFFYLSPKLRKKKFISELGIFLLRKFVWYMKFYALLDFFIKKKYCLQKNPLEICYLFEYLIHQPDQ